MTTDGRSEQHVDWPAARAAMLLDPSIANLNSGSFGPTPRPVFERVTALRRRLAEEPMDFLVRAMPPLLWRARRRLADFLGTRAERLVFTANVSSAVNLVAAGLTLPQPGEILLSDREYGAMHWCWERAAKRWGLELQTFHLPLMPERGDEIVDAVAAAISPRTRLVFFSHVYSATGLIVPAADICDLARRHGAISVVDGAHAPAMIPLDIDSIGCDVYCGNCHKWLLAPIGSGFLVLGSTPPPDLEPLQVSWGYKPDCSRWDQPDEFGSTPRTRFLEFEGTRDPCAWLAVPDAIDFQSQIGWDAIRLRMRQLSAHARQRLAGRHGLRLTTPEHPTLHAAMTAYWWPAGADPETLRQRLWDRKIEALVGEWPDGLTLRVSNHFYNTESEIDRLGDAIPEILAGA